MKRFILFLSLSLVLSAMVACGFTDVTSTKTKEKSVVQGFGDPSKTGVDETVTVGSSSMDNSKRAEICERECFNTCNSEVPKKTCNQSSIQIFLVDPVNFRCEFKCNGDPMVFKKGKSLIHGLK